MIENGADFLNCKDEQRFKMLYIKKRLQKEYNYIFCIETEETTRGFPDVMEFMLSTKQSKFYEFKFSDKNGKIKFQPTQPSFYKRHPEMEIEVIAYNRKTASVNRFLASSVFCPGSTYEINDRAEVTLI